jgi:hypothetical protein
MSDHDLLIHIAGKVEVLVGNGQPGRCAEHNERLVKIEGWREKIIGGARVAGWIAFGLTSSGGAMLIAKALLK